jgi:hypothetical protein
MRRVEPPAHTEFKAEDVNNANAAVVLSANPRNEKTARLV